MAALIYFVIGAEFSHHFFTPGVLLCVCVSVYHKGSTALAVATQWATGKHATLYYVVQ